MVVNAQYFTKLPIIKKQALAFHKNLEFLQNFVCQVLVHEGSFHLYSTYYRCDLRRNIKNVYCGCMENAKYNTNIIVTV